VTSTSARTTQGGWPSRQEAGGETILGDLAKDFDFTQTPRPPLLLLTHPRPIRSVALWRGNVIQLLDVPNVTFKALRDARPVGWATALLTDDPADRCLARVPLRVWRATTEFPGDYLAQATPRSRSCGQATWMIRTSPAQPRPFIR